MDFPKKVILTEVGPRDGLQNERISVPTNIKIAYIHALAESGFQHIEVTSFVSPKAIPQLADSAEVYSEIKKLPGVRYSVLVPNEQGMEKALSVGVTEIAIFTAASEQFNQHNIHCSIQQSLERFKPVIALARLHNIKVRAYISCALGCPYEGHIKPEAVCAVMDALLPMGIDEFSLGDTIGVGTPKQTKELLDQVLKRIDPSILNMHFHDTFGQAVANIYAALQMGIYHFDSATAGLGGCPYALGASGNVATEDVLYLMHGLGIETGIDIFKVVQAGDMICGEVGKKNNSKVANALLAKGAL